MMDILYCLGILTFIASFRGRLHAPSSRRLAAPSPNY